MCALRSLNVLPQSGRGHPPFSADEDTVIEEGTVVEEDTVGEN